MAKTNFIETMVTYNALRKSLPLVGNRNDLIAFKFKQTSWIKYRLR